MWVIGTASHSTALPQSPLLHPFVAVSISNTNIRLEQDDDDPLFSSYLCWLGAGEFSLSQASLHLTGEARWPCWRFKATFSYQSKIQSIGPQKDTCLKLWRTTAGQCRPSMCKLWAIPCETRSDYTGEKHIVLAGGRAHLVLQQISCMERED